MRVSVAPRGRAVAEREFACNGGGRAYNSPFNFPLIANYHSWLHLEQIMDTLIFLMQGGGFDWTIIILIGGIFVVFYFLMMRPQKKERERLKMMLENLRKNDEVVTAGGIHGKVASIKDDIIVLRVDDNSDVKLRVSRTSIVGVTVRDGEEADEN